MQCPDCGGAMWDNRLTKKKPTQPDYKCKNKACDKAVWLKTQAENATASNGTGNGTQSAAAPRGRALGPLYVECLDFAKKAIPHYLGTGYSSADIIAAAATLFIQATRDGAPIRVPKAKPAPPPPPPPPPVEEFAGFPEEVDDLPF